MAQDVVQAFVMMAIFFPNLELTKIVQDYLKSEDGLSLRSSGLLDTATRATRIPDRRTRISNFSRPASFYKELGAIMTGKEHPADICPMPWSITARPIIARCECSRLILSFTSC